MTKILPIAFVVLIIAGLGVWWQFGQKQIAVVNNFEECTKAGNPVMESYPRQCRHGDKTFTENIGNELEKADFIRIDSPRPNQVVQSPLTITGQARGQWFFEASFPVFLTDWDGKIMAQGIATAKSEWMTADFVPFEATLTFTVDKEIYSNRGTLILRKDNPSGLPEHDDALEIPLVLGGTTGKIPTSADNAPPGSIHNLPVPEAVSAVRRLVARELGVGEGVVIVMSAHKKDWPDGCLGLAKKDEFCTQAIVSGYEVTVQAQGTERVYRTNADGSILRREK